MSTPDQSAALSPPRQQESSSREEAAAENGQQTPFSSYPPATASYEDVSQSSDLFLEKLKSFHQSFDTKFLVPIVGEKPLDLHQLFVEVTSRGGIWKVIRDRLWQDVVASFNFPSSVTSASFVLRKYYLSLLYHFEQVYLFRKQVPSLSAPDSVNESVVNGSAMPDDGTNTNDLSGNPVLQLGCSVTGTIDVKFDDGYVVTVNLGHTQLQGILYHTPTAVPGSPILHTSDLPQRRRRKRSRLSLLDYSWPKSKRTAYSFFFDEQYTQLKPKRHGRDRVNSKNEHLQASPTEAEYQDKGLEHKGEARD